MRELLEAPHLRALLGSPGSSRERPGTALEATHIRRPSARHDHHCTVTFCVRGPHPWIPPTRTQNYLENVVPLLNAAGFPFLSLFPTQCGVAAVCTALAAHQALRSWREDSKGTRGMCRS